MVGATDRELLVDDRGRLRLATTALLLAAILAPALARHFTPVADAVAGVYAIGYEAGFLRRALLGSLLGPVEEAPIFARRVAVFGLVLLVLNAGLVFVFALRAARAQPAAGHVVAIAVCAAPITLGYFAWDLARPEQVGYGLALALCLAMAATSLRPTWWAAGMAMATVAGVAVHESFPLVQMPLMLAIYGIRARESERSGLALVPAAGVAVLGFVGAGLLLWLGTREPQAARATLAQVQAVYPDLPAAPVMAQAKGLVGGMRDAAAALGVPRNVKGLASAALVLAVVAALVGWALRRTAPPRDAAVARAERIALPLAGTPPVLMCALHPDMTRWLAYAGLNLLVVACVLLARRTPSAAAKGATPAWVLVLYGVVFLAVLPRWNMFGGIDMPDLLQTFLTDCLLQDPPRMAACTR